MINNTYTEDVNLKLAVEIRQGNQKSLAVLYDKYAPTLSGIINNMSNDASLNENILKNSFVKVWNHIDAYNSTNCSLFTWLINIARHTAFEEIRMEKKQNSNNNNPVYNTHKKDAQQLTAFDLVYYRGLNYVETAAVLQTTVATVKEDIRKMKTII